MKFENVLMLLPGRRAATGDLTVEGDRIASVVERACVPDRLVMPGLVNCHGHTAMTLVRGLGGGLPLQRWLEEAIFPVEAKMTAEHVRAGTVWGIAEMFAGGTVTVADMYDFPEACEEAFDAAGMTAFVGRVGLSFAPGRQAECIRFAEAHPRSHLTVHSEYLTDEPFCRGLAEANRRLRRPVHFHCSETEKEHRECLERHGLTPLAYLVRTGLLDFGGYAAHCVWCTDDDFRLMAEKGISLVHNPSSNLKLGSGFARIVRARELGVNVALGTDGCASNDNLDLFEEMHLASLLHKGVARDPTALGAWDVIEMATVNGARALGLKDRGELAVGQRADLCVADLNRPHLLPCLDAANLVVHSMHASDVAMTVAGGKVVYDRGRYPTLDFVRARADFAAAVRALHPQPRF